MPSHLRGNSSASPHPLRDHLTRDAIPPHLRDPQTTPSARGIPSIPAAQATNGHVNPARAFPCSFADCEEAFPTEALLLRHKGSPYSGHDHCKLCKLDFEDDSAYHLHKMQSEMHAHEQNITCRGCGKVFLKGAALLNHIEQNQCPGIDKTDFETQRAMMAIAMHNISNSENNDDDALSFPSSTAGDSQGGGVRLDGLSLLDENETRDALDEASPKLGSHSSQSSASTSKDTPFRSKLYESNYPTLGSEPKGKTKRSEASTTSESESVRVNESWVNHNFPGAPQTPAPPGWTPIPSSENGLLSTINPANGQIGHFRVMDLKRDVVTGHYYCPFMKCPHGPYPTVEQVQEHLRSGIHQVTHRCVGCLRTFKSPSALTAHMESSSERCRVRESREFGNALSLVSGGYLGINGRHADGSIKIDSPDYGTTDHPIPKW
ncbi:hypothetical protein MMC07_005582 [Pseudocyphellaria aurata]|nr:hypothetical protein [Pseudocyphellaria aurata]